MEKTLNKKKSKLEINSLEYLFVKDLTEHKSNQIRGGYSIYPPNNILLLEDEDTFVLYINSNL